MITKHIGHIGSTVLYFKRSSILFNIKILISSNTVQQDWPYTYSKCKNNDFLNWWYELVTPIFRWYNLFCLSDILIPKSCFLQHVEHQNSCLYLISTSNILCLLIIQSRNKGSLGLPFFLKSTLIDIPKLVSQQTQLFLCWREKRSSWMSN